MKVIVPLKIWESKEKITIIEIDKETKKEKKVEKEITIKNYKPDISIPYIVIQYNYRDNTAIVEINNKDLNKIKDKVIEIIEDGRTNNNS